jgi:hypothetical protein
MVITELLTLVAAVALAAETEEQKMAATAARVLLLLDMRFKG